MTDIKNKQLIETAIETLKMVEKMIVISYQISHAITKDKKIKAEDLKPIKSPVPISTPWKEHPEDVNILSAKIPDFCLFACLILCKQARTTLKNENVIDYAKKDNKNLYSTENILKIIRDAYAHIEILSNKTAQPTYFFDKKNNKEKKHKLKQLFEVKITNKNQTIHITLDTRNKKTGDYFSFKDVKGKMTNNITGITENITGILAVLLLLQHLRAYLEKNLISI